MTTTVEAGDVGKLSDRSRASVTAPVPETSRTSGPQRSSPVKIWAAVGGALLLLQVYVWTRWVAGPYFQRVPPGPTDPPTMMKFILVANTIVLAAGLPIGIWWFIVRPWRRERRITLDGMLLVAMGLMFFQDPLLNYLNTWCTYNTWVWNKGSWSPYVPGWVSPEQPGAMVAEPLISNAAGYSYGVLLITIIGCWVMGKVKGRWPTISNFRLIAVTYAFTFVLDFVMEAMLLLPSGVFVYPGAIQSLSVNAGHYYQWPVYEGLMWGGVQAALCCLRFFTDDRGRTIVERGLDTVRGGVVRQQCVRFLAIFAGVSSCFFVFYIIPAQWVGMHADPWPEDITKRSYFVSGLCGDGTDRLCPDPALPMSTRESGYINDKGQLILPEGVELQPNVPFSRGG